MGGDWVWVLRAFDRNMEYGDGLCAGRSLSKKLLRLRTTSGKEFEQEIYFEIQTKKLTTIAS